MNRSEKIQRYLDGEMTEDEVRQFRNELLHDPQLREETELYRLIDESLRRRDEVRFRQKLKDAYSHFELSHSQPFSVRKWHRIWTISGLAIGAALLVLVLILIIPSNTYTNEELYAFYYAPMSLDLKSRSSAVGNKQNFLSEGIAYYIHGQYEKAAESIRIYLESDPLDSLNAFFFLGLSRMETMDIEGSMECFRKLLDTEFNYYREHAEWYMALACLKENNLSLCKSYLDSISQNRSIYSERSSEILQKISKIK